MCRIKQSSILRCGHTIIIAIQLLFVGVVAGGLYVLASKRARHGRVTLKVEAIAIFAFAVIRIAMLALGI